MLVFRAGNARNMLNLRFICVMKRIAFFMLFFVLLWACKKDSGPANGKSAQPNYKLDTLVSMSASINGRAFLTDSVFGYDVHPTITDSVMNFNLLVNATEKVHDSISVIQLYVTSFTGPGVYPINPPAVTAAWYLNGQRHFASTGTITVISDTAYALIAQFNFIADSITVANGYFNVLMPY